MASAAAASRAVATSSCSSSAKAARTSSPDATLSPASDSPSFCNARSYKGTAPMPALFDIRRPGVCQKPRLPEHLLVKAASYDAARPQRLNSEENLMPKNQHVVPHADGWAVKGEGNTRATKVYDTQRDAI